MILPNPNIGFEIKRWIYVLATLYLIASIVIFRWHKTGCITGIIKACTCIILSIAAIGIGISTYIKNLRLSDFHRMSAESGILICLILGIIFATYFIFNLLAFIKYKKSLTK